MSYLNINDLCQYQIISGIVYLTGMDIDIDNYCFIYAQVYVVYFASFVW